MRYKSEKYKNILIKFRNFYNECGNVRVVAYIKTPRGIKGVEGKTKQEAFSEIKVLIDGVNMTPIQRRK